MFKYFISVLERERETENTPIFQFTPQILMQGGGCIQEPRTQSRSPLWVAGLQFLDSSLSPWVYIGRKLDLETRARNGTPVLRGRMWTS